jgi:CubicO group peptidase (beta-lactamase class C family)
MTWRGPRTAASREDPAQRATFDDDCRPGHAPRQRFRAPRPRFDYSRAVHLVLLLSIMSVLGKACTDPVDMLFDLTYGGKHPGASVAVIKDGAIVFERSYGMANIEGGEKATALTNYRLASMTKQFTAMSILILEDKGQLKLDDRVAKYLPELASAAPTVTVRHLLTHTSGLPEYEPLMAKDDTNQILDAGVLALVAKQKLELKPGSRFKYGNTGYVLLAMVVERVSKLAFSEFLNRHIFKPLGMTNSIAYAEKTPIKNRAFGYHGKDDQFARADQNRITAVLGDGGIYSSVTDLARWIDSLDKSTLIKQKRLTDATSKQVQTSEPGIGYGYGWRISVEKGEKVVFHTGTTSGFKNALMWVPSRKLGVIVLTNRKDSDSLRLAWRVLEHFWEHSAAP